MKTKSYKYLSTAARSNPFYTHGAVFIGDPLRKDQRFAASHMLAMPAIEPRYKFVSEGVVRRWIMGYTTGGDIGVCCYDTLKCVAPPLDVKADIIFETQEEATAYLERVIKSYFDSSKWASVGGS